MPKSIMTQKCQVQAENGLKKLNLKLSLLTTTNIKNILCDIVDVAYNNFLSLII